MARKTKEEAEKTRQALLEAAAKLFTHQGVANTTLNEIASQAGVTRGAFYWYFSDKGDVIKALWATYALPKMDPIRVKLANLDEQDPLAEFRTIVGQMVRMFIEEEKVCQTVNIVLHNMELASKDDALIDYLYGEHLKFQNAMVQAFTAMQKKGQVSTIIPAEQAALGFTSLFIGMLDKYLLPFAEVDLEKDGVPILNIYIQGLIHS